MAKCKSEKCGAEIIFAKTEVQGRSRNLPYDAEPAEKGSWSIDTSGEEPVAKYVNKDQRKQTAMVPLYHWPHWATCKDPQQFGGRQKKERGK
jgi:hypothetical protein